MTKRKDRPTMTPETMEKGREFIRALLSEGRDYRSIQGCLRVALVTEALPRYENNASKTARALDVTNTAVRQWMEQAGLERTVAVVQEGA